MNINIKTDYTNPERILSYNEAKKITQKEYSLLKQPLKEIKPENYPELDYHYYRDKAIESRKKELIYSDQTGLKKEVLIANTILPDDIKIIDKLTANGFTYEHLYAIIRFRSILKNILMNNTKITNDLKEHIRIYKNVTTKLIKVFEQNFFFNDSTIILNRICEMLITCPHLFESINKNKKLTK